MANSDCKNGMLDGACDADRIKNIFQQRAAALARRETADQFADDATPALVFGLGDVHCALPLTELTEVLPFADCTPVPGTDAWVCGIINVRGNLHAVLDLAAMMGQTEAEEGLKRHVLLLKHNRAGLRVGSLAHIRALQPTELSDRPNDGGTASIPFSRTVLADRIVVLDVAQILAHPIFDTKGEHPC